MKLPKIVLYKGNRTTEEWAKNIEATQLRPTVVLGGRSYPRFLVGQENKRPPDQIACPSCLEVRDQFNQWGCDSEVCPRCGDQLFICNCPRGTLTLKEMNDFVCFMGCIIDELAQHRRLLLRDIQAAEQSAGSR